MGSLLAERLHVNSVDGVIVKNTCMNNVDGRTYRRRTPVDTGDGLTQCFAIPYCWSLYLPKRPAQTIIRSSKQPLEGAIKRAFQDTVACSVSVFRSLLGTTVFCCSSRWNQNGASGLCHEIASYVRDAPPPARRCAHGPLSRWVMSSDTYGAAYSARWSFSFARTNTDDHHGGSTKRAPPVILPVRSD
jgi:hypothetical protein